MREPLFRDLIAEGGGIAHVEELPAQRAHFLAPSASIHPKLKERLDELGMAELYVHQALAYDAAAKGEDLVIVTGTNSGKTLCYNLPAIQAILSEPDVRALYLFPTKALAQDQLSKLHELAPREVRAACYDGDTPTSQRSTIRRSAQIILTNPDMLHVGILPNHETWLKFLKTVRYVVVDEMHVYRGVFGSHVGGVIRRLLRLCEWHRNRPQVIACSATIGNPTDLFRRLTGRSATLIDDDGAPRAKRTFVFWNPPMVDTQTRLGANAATSEIVASLVETEARVLAFCRSRVSTELVLRQTRQRLERAGHPQEWVESYRSGYTPKERRQIEQALFKGHLRALVATSAMELGVDVGTLDAVVMNGYPGSVASFWQQAGRAGRGSRPGLAILVAQDDPLDQFLMREPRLLLEASVESVAVNPENASILTQQLRCAAHERPISVSELQQFGESALPVAEALDKAGELRYQERLFYYPSFDPPAPRVDIRNAGGGSIALIVDGEVLGTMERWRALQYAHEGAVYLHRGQTYIVDRLDLQAGLARLRADSPPFYTQAIHQTVVEQRAQLAGELGEEFGVRLVGISVTDSVVGYKQKALDGERVLAVHDLDLPDETFDTLSVRFDLPTRWAPEGSDPDDPVLYLASIHGAEHALTAVAPLFAGCDRGDLGSAFYSVTPDSLRPSLFVFDRVPGGVGLAERLLVDRVEWVGAARRLLAGCACSDGCPSCLLSSRCSVNNELLSKNGALALLRDLGDSPSKSGTTL